VVKGFEYFHDPESCVVGAIAPGMVSRGKLVSGTHKPLAERLGVGVLSSEKEGHFAAAVSHRRKGSDCCLYVCTKKHLNLKDGVLEGSPPGIPLFSKGTSIWAMTE